MVLKCLRYNFGWHQGYSLFYKYTYICWYNAFLWSCISLIPTSYINDNHCKYPCRVKEVHLLFRHQMPYNVHGLSNLCARKREDHVLTFNSAIPNVSCLIFLHLMIKTVWLTWYTINCFARVIEDKVDLLLRS